MLDINKFDTETRVYFDSLPILIKETIMQSGAQFSNRQELERYAQSVMNQK